MDYERRRLVRESATYLAATETGEEAAYFVRLAELPRGAWSVHLMALPWDTKYEAEQTFPTVEQACAAADSLYAKGIDGGRWDIRRWGWQRPLAPAQAD